MLKDCVQVASKVWHIFTICSTMKPHAAAVYTGLLRYINANSQSQTPEIQYGAGMLSALLISKHFIFNGPVCIFGMSC